MGVDQLALAHEELQVLAATDNLTKVLNRGAFTMLVEAYLERASKQVQMRAGALLIIDADHFKSINDRFGHERGDEALRLIARSIKTVVREADLVGRIGGEEFAVFLPGADPATAEILAERIRRSVNVAEFTASGRHEPLSVSVGGAVFAGPASFDTLYVAADECLYGAKSNGRNRVEMCSIVGDRSVQPA